MAVQSRARQYIPPAPLPPEVIETKTSRPISQSWSSMRRSAVSNKLWMLFATTHARCVNLNAEFYEYNWGKVVQKPCDRLLTQWQIRTWPPTEEHLLCLIESLESLLYRQFYSCLRTPSWVTKIRGVIFLCLFGKYDKWMAFKVAFGLMLRCLQTFPSSGCCWFGPFTAVDCFAYVYPGLGTDALTSQLTVMSTHWSLSAERVAQCWTPRFNRDTNHFVSLLG